MTGIIGLYKRYATQQRVAEQLSLLFQIRKWVAWKSENIKYLWHYST